MCLRETDTGYEGILNAGNTKIHGNENTTLSKVIDSLHNNIVKKTENLISSEGGLCPHCQKYTVVNKICSTCGVGGGDFFRSNNNEHKVYKILKEEHKGYNFFCTNFSEEEGIFQFKLQANNNEKLLNLKINIHGNQYSIIMDQGNKPLPRLDGISLLIFIEENIERLIRNSFYKYGLSQPEGKIYKSKEDIIIKTKPEIKKESIPEIIKDDNIELGSITIGNNQKTVLFNKAESKINKLFKFNDRENQEGSLSFNIGGKKYLLKFSCYIHHENGGNHTEDDDISTFELDKTELFYFDGDNNSNICKNEDIILGIIGNKKLNISCSNQNKIGLACDIINCQHKYF